LYFHWTTMRFLALFALASISCLPSAPATPLPSPTSNGPTDCAGVRMKNVISRPPTRIPILSGTRQQRHKNGLSTDAPKPWQPKFPGDIPPDYDSACEWVKQADADFETKWAEIRK